MMLATIMLMVMAMMAMMVVMAMMYPLLPDPLIPVASRAGTWVSGSQIRVADPLLRDPLLPVGSKAIESCTYMCTYMLTYAHPVDPPLRGGLFRFLMFC